jgi:hypothetical protein
MTIAVADSSAASRVEEAAPLALGPSIISSNPKGDGADNREDGPIVEEEVLVEGGVSGRTLDRFVDFIPLEIGRVRSSSSSFTDDENERLHRFAKFVTSRL